MGKKNTTLFLFLLIQFNLIAQGSWFWQNPKPTGVNLNKVFFISSTTGWAVGDGGVILKTTDKGLSWKQQLSNSTSKLATIFFVNENVGWSAGAGNYPLNSILKTKNGGDKWISTELPEYSYINTMFFTDENHGWAAGSNLFKTDDGGETWGKINLISGDNENFSSFMEIKFSNKHEGWILGWNYLLHTNDGGNTWEEIKTLPKFSNISFSHIFFVENVILLSISNSNLTVTSSNAGKDWQINNVGITLNDVSFCGNKGYAISQSSKNICVSLSGGQTWTPALYSEDVQYIASLFAIDSSNIGMVGTNGRIFLSSDAGDSWKSISTTLIGTFTCGSFINELTGWVVSPGSGILHTTNGGQEWLFDTTGAKLSLSTISFPDENTGFAAGNNGKIIKTMDGGETWQEQNSGVSFNLRTSKFIDNKKGFMGGDDGIIITTDGGNTWTYKKMATIISFSFINDQTGWALSHSLLFKTTNGGDSWEQIPGVDFYACARSICFVSDSVGYECGLYFSIYKTTDGGITWKPKKGFWDVAGELNSLAFIDDNRGWTVGDNGYIWATKNGGDTWLNLSDLTRSRLNNISFINGKTGWIVGENSTILKTVTGDIIGAVNQDIKTPDKYLLSQNYPNPFNPTTTIEYSIPSLSLVTLKVYDILGREVATLVNDEKPAGKYKVTFNGSELASGVYFYRIEAGGYSSSKKLILVK